MTEHREPPRIAAGDRRFEAALEGNVGRFTLMRGQRQLNYGRSLFFVLSALTALCILLYIGFQGIRTSLDWLSHQGPYQLPFEQIQLIPEPPPWFRGGRRVFLEGVRAHSGESEIISILEVPPERLRADFKKYPWVRDVELFYGPRSISVKLRYRQPVAYVDLPPADRNPTANRMLLDETGTILSIADVDPSRLEHLIGISRTGLRAPADSQFGVLWKSRAKGSDLDEPDRAIMAATKLAGFLNQSAQLGDAERSSALRISNINLNEFQRFGGIFLRNADGVAIWWKDAPGDEPPGRPNADQKWAMLRRWGEATDHEPLPEGDYLAFKTADVELKCFHDDRPHKLQSADEGKGAK